MGAGGSGDDAIRGIAVEIRNAVGVAGDFRGEMQEFQAIEECLGDPFFEGSAEGESAVGLFLGDLDDADGRECDATLCQEDFTDPKRDLGGGLTMVISFMQIKCLWLLGKALWARQIGRFQFSYD
jgi:hypothetical protein